MLLLDTKSLARRVSKYFFIGQNKIGVIKPFLNTTERIRLKILCHLFLQFYENKAIPALIITNLDINEKTLLEKTFSNKENKQIAIKKAKSKNEINISQLARKNAKQAFNSKLIQSDTNNNLIENLATKFKINENIDLIEVYDNSHIQGTDSIGALICFGPRGIY